MGLKPYRQVHTSWAQLFSYSLPLEIKGPDRCEKRVKRTDRNRSEADELGILLFLVTDVRQR